MFQNIFLLLSLYLWALPHLTTAMTEEQKNKIHQEFQILGAECIKDHVITEDDIKNLKSNNLPSGDNAPCFLACIMKKAGLMDDNGMLQSEKALESAKSIFDDEEELKNIRDYLHSCAHVNAETVTDGEKGCERAILSFKCMTENASKFGFEM